MLVGSQRRKAPILCDWESDWQAAAGEHAMIYYSGLHPLRSHAEIGTQCKDKLTTFVESTKRKCARVRIRGVVSTSTSHERRTRSGNRAPQKKLRNSSIVTLNSKPAGPGKRSRRGVAECREHSFHVLLAKDSSPQVAPSGVQLRSPQAMPASNW